MNHEPQTYCDLQDAGNAQSQLLLQAIARHADWDTGECYPCVKTLARMAKCSEKTARRHIAKLEADGFIEQEERHRDDGGRSSNLLRLVGYEKWISANRKGGRVNKPRAAKKYEDPPGQPDQAPLVKTTAPPGHNGTTPPGQQGDQAKNNQSNHQVTDRDRSCENGSDDRKRRPAVLHRFVSEAALDRVRDIAPGWDRQALLRKFTDWPGSKSARDMDAAFLGWVPKFTKGAAPS